MTSASKTSNRRFYKVLPLWDASEKARQLPRAERDRFWRDQLAPPDVRGRKREARRWLDTLTVMSTNPCRSERRREDLWLTVAESRRLWDLAHEQLRASDPSLHRAVARIHWENRVANEGITVKEWQDRIARNWPALERLRAQVYQEERSAFPMAWTQVSAVLRRRFPSDSGPRS